MCVPDLIRDRGGLAARALQREPGALIRPNGGGVVGIDEQLGTVDPSARESPVQNKPQERARQALPAYLRINRDAAKTNRGEALIEAQLEMPGHTRVLHDGPNLARRINAAMIADQAAHFAGLQRPGEAGSSPLQRLALRREPSEKRLDVTLTKLAKRQRHVVTSLGAAPGHGTVDRRVSSGFPRSRTGARPSFAGAKYLPVR